MPFDNVRGRKRRRKYSLILIPDGDSQHTRTFTLSALRIIAFLSAAIIVAIAFVLAVVVYTPVGKYLPISHTEADFMYGGQIVQIQERLNILLDEMVALRTYNLRLRKALGESISPQDSSFIQRFDERLGSAYTPHSAGEADAPARDAAGFSEAGGNGRIAQSAPPVVQWTVRNASSSADEFPLNQPTQGYLTRPFEAENSHLGIDFAGKEGTPIMAAAPGSVVLADWTYDDGFLLIVSHAQGYMTVYKHNQALLKSAGDAVKRGEIVALLGNTGRTSSGPHLHFEVWKDGAVQDPANFLLTVE